MVRLSIGDVLLIKQKDPVVTPWSYRILSLPGQSIITSENNISQSHKLVTLTSALFSAHLKKTVLVEIIVANQPTDILLVTISGIYNKLTGIKILVGLLGENMKIESATFQDGFDTEKTITLYNENTLTTELESYNWVREFVNDFIPDYRYQDQKVIQKVN